jgi:uncharacterized membrane protein
MAIITGIIVHLYWWMMLSVSRLSGGTLVLASAGGLILLLGLATAHLGNHTVRQWIWRAPLFALIESATGAGMAALLIALGAERRGTGFAHRGDWLSIAYGILIVHTIALLSFTLVLAAVVQTVRWGLLKHERRTSTAIAIHEERLREEGER